MYVVTLEMAVHRKGRVESEREGRKVSLMGAYMSVYLMYIHGEGYISQ